MIDTQAFRKLLLERQASLRSATADGEDSTQTVALDQTRLGRLSRMDALQAQAMAQAGARRRELELRRIAAALRRIERDEFGECEVCFDPIARARLTVDPSVTQCVACAEKTER